MASVPRPSRTTRLTVIVLIVLVVAALLVARGRALVSDPQDQLQERAAREGGILIYSTTDEPEFASVLSAFRAAHPDVRVTYRSLSALDAYRIFKAEADAGIARADLVINSAMDLQVKLVNDGYAQRHSSREAPSLPDWAVWKEQAFAVTAEPIVIGFNRKLLSPNLVPHTHDELAAILHSRGSALEGKIALYDPELSPTGFLYLNQDLQTDRHSWDLIAALGRQKPKLVRSTREMIDQVSRGELLMAYNIIGPYAFRRAAEDSNFGVAIPQDYTLVMSRVALIPRIAPHPAGAKLFLDFMLSRAGQELLARQYMIPVRQDLEGVSPLAGVTNARAVRVGPALLAGLDRINREKFLTQWRRNVTAAN